MYGHAVCTATNLAAKPGELLGWTIFSVTTQNQGSGERVGSGSRFLSSVPRTTSHLASARRANNIAGFPSSFSPKDPPRHPAYHPHVTGRGKGTPSPSPKQRRMPPNALVGTLVLHLHPPTPARHASHVCWHAWAADEESNVSGHSRSSADQAQLWLAWVVVMGGGDVCGRDHRRFPNKLPRARGGGGNYHWYLIVGRLDSLVSFWYRGGGIALGNGRAWMAKFLILTLAKSFKWCPLAQQRYLSN